MPQKIVLKLAWLDTYQDREAVSFTIAVGDEEDAAYAFTKLRAELQRLEEETRSEAAKRQQLNAEAEAVKAQA